MQICFEKIWFRGTTTTADSSPTSTRDTKSVQESSESIDRTKIEGLNYFTQVPAKVSSSPSDKMLMKSSRGAEIISEMGNTLNRKIRFSDCIATTWSAEHIKYILTVRKWIVKRVSRRKRTTAAFWHSEEKISSSYRCVNKFAIFSCMYSSRNISRKVERKIHTSRAQEEQANMFEEIQFLVAINLANDCTV